MGKYCPDTKNGAVTGGKNCFQGAGLQKEGQSITEALESFGYIPDRGEITFLNTVDEPEVRARLNG